MINNSVKNPDGIWINTELFRTEALHFKKYGYYCPDKWGTYGWKKYWEEQLEYCKNGYSVGGVKITGHHYFYLNFTLMELVEFDERTGKIANKQTDFPHFWDGDYNYFWSLDIAREGCTEDFYKDLSLHVTIPTEYLDGGYHLLVGKARRKGYSYKNAAVVANTYNTIRKSIGIVGAYDKKYLYPQGTMTMTTDVLNFLNEHTGWAKAREYVDKQDHKRASFKEISERGLPIEKGYLSQVIALTFQDNPDAARGKGARFVLLEEGGKFPNIKQAVLATDDTLRAGRYLTGQMVIFGTSGDIDKDSIEFADMFYNPKPFGILPFLNIWDENSENSTCSFFHPMNWNMEGFYDTQGNSDLENAKQFELEKRAKIVKEASSTQVLQQRLQENPLSPSEAFLTISVNNFPVEELRQQKRRVEANNLHLKIGQPGYMMIENGKATFKPDLENRLQPIYNYPPKTKDTTGCVVIFEAPIQGVKKGVYKIGFDPYRQAKAEYSQSLGAVYVYKTIVQGSYKNNIIVAEYIGRPMNMDIYLRNVELLAEYYNAEIMYENEVTSVLSYFEKRKKLHLLAAQPDNIISTHIKASKVDRVFGMHMAEKLKEAGEKYINTWLLTERDTKEDGTKTLNLEEIYSIGLLDELILYNRKGNFDRCVRKGTKISLEVGCEKIENITKKQKILTVDGSLQKVLLTDQHLFKGEMVELSIVGQEENLIVTHNHPILVQYTNKKKHNNRRKLDKLDYLKAEDLNFKYQFALLPKRKNKKRTKYSKDLLYLIGWCLGDGYVNKETGVITIALQSNQEHIADKLLTIIEKYSKGEKNTVVNSFVRYGEVIKTNRSYERFPAKKYKKKNHILICKRSKILSNILYNAGCKPNNKQINKNLYNSNNLMPLVIGFLEADGHQKFTTVKNLYPRCNIEVSGIHQNLIRQVRQILLDNGIWCSLNLMKKRVNSNQQLRLDIGTNYIDKLLKFYPSLKFKKCDIQLQKYNQIEDETGFWTPIKKVKSFYTEEIVYNLSVDTNHTYIAGGIVNHNCMALMMVLFQVEADSEVNNPNITKKLDKMKEQLLNLEKNLYKR